MTTNKKKSSNFYTVSVRLHVARSGRVRADAIGRMSKIEIESESYPRCQRGAGWKIELGGEGRCVDDERYSATLFTQISLCLT